MNEYDSKEQKFLRYFGSTFVLQIENDEVVSVKLKSSHPEYPFTDKISTVFPSEHIYWTGDYNYGDVETPNFRDIVGWDGVIFKTNTHYIAQYYGMEFMFSPYFGEEGLQITWEKIPQ